MASPSIDELNSWREKATRLLEARSYFEAVGLFQNLLDNGIASAASQLGYIFSRSDNPDYDREKAISYYRIAAENGDTYAQYALGALLTEAGNQEEALQWYRKASDLGHGTCSFLAYRELAKRGDIGASQQYFTKALEQRNPAAIQQHSIQKIKGQFGVRAILPGLIEYIGNFPRMARFIRENVSRPSTR